MFKVTFDFLTEPLGLPIAWYWEYIILTIIGLIAYKISFNIVGDMYRADFISGRTAGSFFHWLIRLFVFAVMWGVTYSLIWLGKLIIVNLQMILIVLGISGLCALAIFGMREIKNSKAGSKDA